MARLKRGVALLGVLLTLTLLLVLAMGYLSQQLHRYRAATQLRLRLQAQSLAEMGWRETEIKLLKDQNFPPAADPDQKIFAYSEPVLDSQGRRQGFYHVRFDRSQIVEQQLLICTVEGEVCPEQSGPQQVGLARHSLKIEWDVAQPARRPFRWLMVESGSW